MVARRYTRKTRSNRQKKVLFPHRTQSMIVFVMLLFGLIVFRLYNLQIVNGDKYRLQAESQRSSTIEIPARRGEILVEDTDKNLAKLAINTTLDVVFVDPFITPDKELVANDLAPLLYNREKDHTLCIENHEYCPTGSVTFQTDSSGLEDPEKPLLPNYDVALKQYRDNLLARISRDQIDYITVKSNLTDQELEELAKINIAGMDIDREGRWLGLDLKLVPEDKKGNIAQELANILEISASELEKNMVIRPQRYVELKKRVSVEVSEAIEKLWAKYENQHLESRSALNQTGSDAEPTPNYFRGVGLKPNHLRYYPDGQVAAQIMGFVNREGAGQYGIEGKWDQVLTGKKGIIKTQNDVNHQQVTWLEDNIQNAEDGDSVVLTIDRIIQKNIEEILAEEVESYKADSGQIVVMDPVSGDIIALANYPTFDPNHYNNVYLRRRTTPRDFERIYKTTPLFKKDEQGILVPADYEEYQKAWKLGHDPEFYIYENWLGIGSYTNKAVQEVYEPGSVFKPIALAMAIDAGETSPSAICNEDGPVEVDEYEIRTATDKYNGKITMLEALAESSNPCMVEEVAFPLGKTLFYDYLKRFGFGEFTNIALENETNGTVRFHKKWSRSLLATSSFGQGFSATPLQVASAWATLANGGYSVKPRIVKATIDSQTGTRKDLEKKPGERVISADTAEIMTSMLVYSVNEGVADRGKVPGYNLAGKTGTSQIASTDKRGYEDNNGEDRSGNVVTSFAGYGPVDRPQFVILVKFDRPKLGENTWGSTTAANTFRKTASFLLNHYGVPPDDHSSLSAE